MPVEHVKDGILPGRVFLVILWQDYPIVHLSTDSAAVEPDFLCASDLNCFFCSVTPKQEPYADYGGN